MALLCYKFGKNVDFITLFVACSLQSERVFLKNLLLFATMCIFCLVMRNKPSIEIVRDAVKALLVDLNDLKQECVGQMENFPEGHLRTVLNNGIFRYFHITEKGDSIGAYIPKKDVAIAQGLAQKDYCRKLLEVLNRLTFASENFLKTLSLEELEAYLQNLHPARKQLLEPLWLDDDVFVQQWSSADFRPLDFAADAPEFFSPAGVRVRSKSEVMIASTLERLLIPYRYEQPVKLKGLGVVHPDFICLKKSSRREIIWEHFGRMDDPDYAEKATRKIHCYEKSGFYPGENFLFTMETTNCPLSTRTVEKYVKAFCL